MTKIYSNTVNKHMLCFSWSHTKESNWGDKLKQSESYNSSCNRYHRIGSNGYIQATLKKETDNAASNSMLERYFYSTYLCVFLGVCSTVGVSAAHILVSVIRRPVNTTAFTLKKGTKNGINVMVGSCAQSSKLSPTRRGTMDHKPE